MGTLDYHAMKPQRGLVMLRIIWGAMLAWEGMFAAVMLLVHPAQATGHPATGILVCVALAGMAVSIPITYLVRTMILRRAASKSGDGTVAATARATASIIFWSGCEGVCFFALTCLLITSRVWPFLAIAAVPVTLQVLTFPRSPQA